MIILLSPDESADWCAYENRFLGGYTTGGRKAYPSLDEALAACLIMGTGCGGVTIEPTEFTLRKGSGLGISPDGEVKLQCPCYYTLFPLRDSSSNNPIMLLK